MGQFLKVKRRIKGYKEGKIRKYFVEDKNGGKIEMYKDGNKYEKIKSWQDYRKIIQKIKTRRPIYKHLQIREKKMPKQ